MASRGHNELGLIFTVYALWAGQTMWDSDMLSHLVKTIDVIRLRDRIPLLGAKMAHKQPDACHPGAALWDVVSMQRRTWGLGHVS